MIDFDKMDGYDFEKLIGELLTNMGFDVEITQASGDGGVDVIATSHKPIIKGRYLIQCKHWNSQVGQPAIRDLYGVVMSQRANKGILITTDTFTYQARSFAEQVGIECIDGKELLNILKNNDMFLDEKISLTKSYLEYEVFDRERYAYLKDKINRDKKNIDVYDELFDFLKNFITDENVELMYAGLLNEMYDLCSLVINRFTKKADEDTRNEYNGYKIQIDFLRGNILETFENSNYDRVFLINEKYQFYYHQHRYNIHPNNIIVLANELNFTFVFEHFYFSWIDKCSDEARYENYITTEIWTHKDKCDEWDWESFQEAKQYWDNIPDTIMCFQKKLKFDLIKPYISLNGNIEKDIKTIEMLIRGIK